MEHAGLSGSACSARLRYAAQKSLKGRGHSFCLSLSMMVVKVEPDAQQVISEFVLVGSLPVEILFSSPYFLFFRFRFPFKNTPH